MIKILRFVFILLLGVLGITMCTSSSSLTCRYVETKQVDCQLQDRIFWVIPKRKITITHLNRAYVDYVTGVTKTETGENGRSTASGVMLVNASGEEIQFGRFKEIGGGSERATRRINDFLNTPIDESLTVWRVSWLGTLLGGCLSSISVLILAALYGKWVRAKWLFIKKLNERMLRRIE